MARLLFGMVLLCVLFPVDAAPVNLVNQLKNNPSPYLAMHGEDPVAWQSWGEEVFKLAQKTNKLIFVSSGYFSCHWCHVMQRESYRDEGVARQLNADFIPVKVDRELEPALDAYLIDFVQKSRGIAGWPLNVFLTPDGHPVVGLVYLPKDQFQNVLVQLAGMWKEDSASIRQAAAQAETPQSTESPAPAKTLQPGIGKSLHAETQQAIIQAADEVLGGFGDQAKFPMIAQLNFLLASIRSQPEKRISQFLQLTLEQMATQGLRDHIGGGFFRYTIDPDWQTPHFEKMLYDNALLAGLYLDAASVLHRPDFEAIGKETLNFMLREMSGKNGGMVSSLSAVDNHNVEGGFYLWSIETLKTLLTPKQYQVVQLLWGLQQASRFDAGYLPRFAVSPDQVAAQLGITTDEVMNTLAKAQSTLFAARKSRIAPVDDKQLAAWNGLALAALAKGAKLAGGDQYRQAAHKLRDYLVNRLWDGQMLVRAKSAGNEIAKAGLEDYAYAAQGLLQWALLSGNKEDRLLARRWIDIAWQRFYGIRGWRLSDHINLPGIFSRVVLEDNPMPSLSATMIVVSLRLAELQKDETLRQQAMSALAMSQDVVQAQPFAYSSQVQVIAELNAEEPAALPMRAN